MRSLITDRKYLTKITFYQHDIKALLISLDSLTFNYNNYLQFYAFLSKRFLLLSFFCLFFLNFVCLVCFYY